MNISNLDCWSWKFFLLKNKLDSTVHNAFGGPHRQVCTFCLVIIFGQHEVALINTGAADEMYVKRTLAVTQMEIRQRVNEGELPAVLFNTCMNQVELSPQ